MWPIIADCRCRDTWAGPFLPIWPVFPILPNGRLITDRRSRLYIRGLRRNGLYAEDVLPFTLIADDIGDYTDLWA
jgi:hypothetical protein